MHIHPHKLTCPWARVEKANRGLLQELLVFANLVEPMLKPCFLQLQLPTGPRAAVTRNRTWTAKGDLVLKWCLGGVAVAIVGAYLRSASEAAQNSSDTWLVAAHATIHGESSHRPRLSCSTGHQGGGIRREKDKEDSDPQLPVSRVRGAIADSCTGSRSEMAQMSLWGRHEPRTHTGPPCLSTAPLWNKGSGTYRSESTCLTGTGPAQAWISGLLL